MTVLQPIITTHRATDLQVASAIKSACSWVKFGSVCVVLGAAVLLVYWWLLVPTTCWLIARAALRAAREARANRHPT